MLHKVERSFLCNLPIVSAICTILGIFPLKSLCNLPIDFLCGVWYNENFGPGACARADKKDRCKTIQRSLYFVSLYPRGLRGLLPPRSVGVRIRQG